MGDYAGFVARVKKDSRIEDAITEIEGAGMTVTGRHTHMIFGTSKASDPFMALYRVASDIKFDHIDKIVAIGECEGEDCIVCDASGHEYCS